MTADLPQLLTQKEAAARLGLSRDLVRELVAGVPFVVIRKRHYYDAADIRTAIERRRVKPAPAPAEPEAKRTRRRRAPATPSADVLSYAEGRLRILGQPQSS